MKKYEAYKDSGIEWIGEIPSSWNNCRLAFNGNFYKGRGVSKADLSIDGLSVILYGDIYTKYNLKTHEFVRRIPIEIAKNSFSIEKGDLIFAASGETPEEIGKCVCYLGDAEAYASGDVIVFRQNQNDSIFLSYLFNSYKINEQKAKLSKGEIVVHIYSGQLRDIRFPLPPFAEQLTIANYLDRKTAEIDELIADKKRLLELFDEEKTAIINQAVTGKDRACPVSTSPASTDVKMKDSGIEWLGEIPEHWEVKPLKSIIERRIDNRGRTPVYGLEGIPMLEVKQISENSKFPVESFEKFVLPNVLENYIREELHEGDILIATVGATAGKCCIVPAKPYYFIAQNVIGFRFYTDNTPMYIYYLIQSDFFKKSLYSINKSNTIDNLKVSVFVNNYVPIPLPKEQLAIANFLDAECTRIDTKISRTEKLIDLLTEYRTALISEVVTGKIKVGE